MRTKERPGCSGYFKCRDTRKVDVLCVQEEKWKEARPWALKVDTNSSILVLIGREME